MLNIIGAGGSSKSGASGGGIAENPNTLVSIALAQIVEAISEGPIVGLMNNEYSIYLDGVGLRDLVGTPNYRPFQWASRNGSQDQTVISGFAGTQQTNSVDTKVTVSGGRIIRPVPDNGADSVRVTMTFPSLTFTTDKGEIQGTTVAYIVGIRPVGGVWVDSAPIVVTGKSSGEYQDTVELPLQVLGASASGYEVSVVRSTADSTSSLLQNDSIWADYVIVNYEQFTYPNTALMAMQIDARYFSAIPTRTYHVRGRIIRVPQNYDPVSCTYATSGPGTTSGAWDGSFKLAYSNNPAWCYFDMLVSTRYGLGKRLNWNETLQNSDYIDKFTLYTIGQYCDDLVPTGVNTTIIGNQVVGGFDMNGQSFAPVTYSQQPVERRFTLNVTINTQQDAYKLLSQLSTAFRGMSYWAQSQVIATQDAPQDVEFILNNSNVKDGKFTYQGSARANRRTVVTVGWNDPTQNFKQQWEYVQDLDGVKRWGVRQTSMVLFGCTSQGQARRAGLWLLYTEKAETDMVVATAGPDSAYILPGMVGEISDRHKAGIRWGGRTLAGSTTTSINLDSSVSLANGSYTLKVKLPNGTLGESQVNISLGTDYTTLTLATALPSVPITGAIWALSSTALSSRIVRCVNRTMDGPDSYTFTMVDHNPSKYQAIEDGLTLTKYDFSVLDMGSVDSIVNLQAIESSYKPAVGQPTKTVVNVGWNQVTSPLQAGYKVTMMGAGQTFNISDTSSSSVTFNDIPLGTYTVTVNALNQFGKMGPDAKTTVTVTGIDSVPPADMAGFTYSIDGLNGVTLKWNVLNDYIDVYEVREGTSWATGTVTGIAKSDRLPGLQLTNAAHQFWLKAKDTSGNYSVNATGLLLDLADIEVPVMVSSFANGQTYLNWNPVSSVLPIVAYDIRWGASWATGTKLGSPAAGPFETTTTWVGDRVFWIEARDSAGNVSLPGTLTVNVGIPFPPTALAYTFFDTDAVLTWLQADGPLPIREFEIRQGASYSTSAFVSRTSSKTINIPATWGAGAANARTYYVSEIDVNGQVGTPASVVVTIAVPGAPNLDGGFFGSNYTLSWSAGTSSLRIDKYIVKTGADFATGVTLATINSLTFTSPVSWFGPQSFFVAAVDCAGNIGLPATKVLTVVGASAPSVLAVVNKNYAASVTWTPAAKGTLPVTGYLVTWTLPDGTVKSFSTSALAMTTDIVWVGNMTFTVSGVDSAGNLGSPGTAILNVVVPYAPVFKATLQIGDSFVLSWTATPGSLPIASYEVRYGTDFATGTSVGILNAQTINVKGAWAGTRKYFVAATDTVGNVGPAGATSITIVIPVAPTVTDTVVDNNVLLRWTDATKTLPILYYNVYRALSGGDFTAATQIGTLLGQFTTVFESTKGYYDYFVTATDSAGNVGPYGKVTAYVNQPPDYQVQLDRDTDFNGSNYEFFTAANAEGWVASGCTAVSQNGILLITSTGTAPLITESLATGFFYGAEHPRLIVKIRRTAGSGWSGTANYVSTSHGISASYYKQVAATIAIGQTAIIEFDMSALTAGGTDWMASQITALQFQFGNTATDVFEVDYIRLVTWKGSNVLLNEDNTLTLPVDMTQLYSAHFTSHAWAGPSAQVTAGYPVYIQPTPTAAYYEQVIDYGATLPGTQVQVTFTSNVSIGTISSVTTLSVKNLWSDAWTDTVGQLNIYAINFRYVKIRIDYTASLGDSVLNFTRCNLKLSLKMRTSQGVVTTGGPTNVQGNLLDYSGWAAGTVYPTNWVKNGNIAENKIASMVSPFPTGLVNELGWVAYNTDASTGADGGFTTPLVTVDPSKSYIFSCFVKKLTVNGIAQLILGTTTMTNTLAGVLSANPISYSGQLPNNTGWYLMVAFLHESTYGTTDTNISGIYDLTGTRVTAGVEFKQVTGVTTQQMNMFHQNNATDTAVDYQYMIRPVIKQSDVASASDVIKYIINAATKDGAFVPFIDNPIDVSTIAVTAAGTKQLTPVYDFVDVPYPKGMNVYVFDSTGAYAKATVSWSLNGTW